MVFRPRTELIPPTRAWSTCPTARRFLAARPKMAPQPRNPVRKPRPPLVRINNPFKKKSRRGRGPGRNIQGRICLAFQEACIIALCDLAAPEPDQHSDDSPDHAPHEVR